MLRNNMKIVKIKQIDKLLPLKFIIKGIPYKHLNEKLLNEFICCTEDEFINKRDEIYKLGRYVIDKINSIYDLDTKNKIKLTIYLTVYSHFLRFSTFIFAI